MSKGTRIIVLAAVTVFMLALTATSAYGYTGYWTPCGSCHATAPTAATVTATEFSNDGTDAVYRITTTGATEWALFAGYTKRESGSVATTVTVPAGATYTVYAISGSPTGGAYATASFTPAATFPVVADGTAPVSASNAVAAYTGSATVRITASDADSGVEYIYFTVNGGSTRTTPIGTDGYAEAFIRPTSAGTFDYTLEFWAQDRNGNLEDPQTAQFTVTRDGDAYSGATPQTTLGTNGMSQWLYEDLSDNTAKWEGGYAAYGGTSGYYADPHGGYDTATNKCKVCHAVHRAEGAYYLLRADSQDDACDYCHIGSAHSSKIVYDLNSAGKSTANGHTIGASTYIPDSTVSQWTEAVTLETVDADGNPLSETIQVRAYDEDKNDMYRFARHHGHSQADGGARRNYVPVGPLALRCMSCHQVHNATAQTWQSYEVVDNAGTHGAERSSYKLLKQFPSGTFLEDASITTVVSGVPTVTVGVDYYGQVPLSNISIVPENEFLTGGVDYDSSRVMGAAPSDTTFQGFTYNRPMWVASDGGFDGEHDPTEDGAEHSIAAAVNNAALSVWCADCHNLNIGGWKHLENEELGFKAHSERTHPAPYTGAHSGPGQCYSCHRNDLPRVNTGDSCSQCHYGTGNYAENRSSGPVGTELVASDFPHSGEDGDYKMLGSYSIVPVDGVLGASGTTIDDSVMVGPGNLDAVCLRCHGGIGTYH